MPEYKKKIEINSYIQSKSLITQTLSLKLPSTSKNL
ncbi:hypothetical protein P872_01420 [Rhodonellum psychrophilum GCM71 = DSM 17998]|uniref:Uncharacterized protein n=1 Tax=Rhodonellum psychrophilum GCM71 = DSM 17998 TaxID=1123057 RepID=U5C6Y3_9BACT|nr:hypothetical protein P872_01420 [Rhodonellum psychrophilum GCM71 = DSM 17998]